MKKLYLGIDRRIDFDEIEGGFLYIGDGVPDVGKRRHRVFDPLKHSVNPLDQLDYRKACDFLDMIDALFSRGDNTLTKDTGLDFIAEALEGDVRRLDKLVPEPKRTSTTGHVWAYGRMQKILRSPVLRPVLCSPRKQFSLADNSIVLARLNRKELGEFDAVVLGLVLMMSYKGQIVVDDFGFYGREAHASLLREDRLIAGLNFFDEIVSNKLQNALMQIDEKVLSGATYPDAKRVAEHRGLRPDPMRENSDYNKFIDAALTS
jgi:hypothetical protein